MVAVAVCSFGQRPYCHIVSAVELTSRSHYQELSCDSVWSDQLRWGQTWRSCRHCDVCFVAGVAVVGVSLFTASPSLVVPAGSPSRGGDVTVYVKNINQPSLPTLFFYSVLVSVSVFVALSVVFHSINSPNNSPFSHSVLPVFFCLTGSFNYISLYKSLLSALI